VAAPTVIREKDPLVLPLLQIVLDELLNQRVGQMLEDILGNEQVRCGEFVRDIADLKPDLAGLVLPANGVNDIRCDVNPEIARATPIDHAREVPISTTGIHD